LEVWGEKKKGWSRDSGGGRGKDFKLGGGMTNSNRQKRAREKGEKGVHATKGGGVTHIREKGVGYQKKGTERKKRNTSDN